VILKHNVLALALASVGICATSVAYAATPRNDSPAGQNTSAEQNAPTTNDTGKDTAQSRAKAQKAAQVKNLQAITVTGFSKSVATAVDIQRYADTIQNVVTSADIGGLPDQSIADALTRLPGVTAERIGGEAGQINCNGLSGSFIQTTLDGRAQPTTSGTNYVKFDQYPSELINQATVYKSSQASLIEGGVGCTIAMQTANPLDNKHDETLNVDFRGSYNNQASDVYGANSMGYRFSAAWQGKFLNDTLGVGLALRAFSSRMSPNSSWARPSMECRPSTALPGNRLILRKAYKCSRTAAVNVGTATCRPSCGSRPTICRSLATAFSRNITMVPSAADSVPSCSTRARRR